MARITSRVEFQEYCLRSLGKPVIEINVDTTQISDRIDEALDYYRLFHTDAVDRLILTHVLTADDITNGYATIVEPIVSILQVFTKSDSLASDNFATDIWQFKADIFKKMNFGGGVTSLSGFVSTMQHLSLVERLFGNFPSFHFNYHTKILRIDDDWSTFIEGDNIGYEAYVELDPETHGSIWNDYWFKKYATALIGQQWGSNLKKFKDFPLPGGLTLNGDDIYNDYTTQIEKLEESLQSDFVGPLDIFVG